MRIPNTTQSRSLSFNLTPLVDVVFLLIIFFLVSMNLNQQEIQLDMLLPRAVTGDPQQLTGKKRIILNVPAEGTLLVGSTPMAPAELRPFLQQQQQLAAGEIEVHLRFNRDIPYRAIEPLLVHIAESDIWDVSFSVWPE